MIEKLDSAIFVIGGPNNVFEALNTKAEILFASYFAQNNVNSVDFPMIFDKIVITDYNKSCLNYLEKIGIQKV